MCIRDRIKTKEKEMSMSDLFNLISKRFDSNDITLNEIKSEFNWKFDVLKFDIDEVKTKCENSCNEWENNWLDNEYNY